jgi:alpha-N-arabinofuranosidase
MTIQANIHVHLDQVTGQVHDYLYGTNLEHLGESIYRGLWAEMLQSPKFAGPDPVFRQAAFGGDPLGRNPDHGVVMPWKSVNPDYQRVIFDHDNTHYYAGLVTAADVAVRPAMADVQSATFALPGMRLAYTGPQSQRITLREADEQQHGIVQGDLDLQGGRAYQVRLVLKGEGQAVQVRLADQTWTIPSVGSDWETFETTLTPSESNQGGELAITVQQAGTLWIGRASLMPADNISGWRADAIAAIQANWTPSFLRWPGGNFVSSYDWMDGVGDRDRRPAYLDPAWQLWESNDVGTDEFMELCKLLDTEPILTLNMGTGTVDEAAAWVEYCNGAADTEYGALRAAHGHPEPYNVRTWFVGNEQFGNWQDGHSDAETYAHRYLDFARAVRKIDSDLTLIGVGVPSDQHGHWNERVLEIAGAEMDMLSLHWYSIRTMRWPEPPSLEEALPYQLAAGHEVDLMLQKTIEIAAAHTDPAVPIAFDEWNTYIRAKPPFYVEDFNLADGLFTGVLMNACLRRCSQVKMSAGFNFINVMGNYRITPNQVWWTPATTILKLMTEQRGESGVDCTVDSPTFSSPAIAAQFAYEAVPSIDAAATLETSQQVLYISLVNLDPSQEAELAWEGLSRSADSTVFTVTADSAIAMNAPEDLTAVSIQEATWPAGQDTLTVPKHSFNLIRIAL